MNIKQKQWQLYFLGYYDGKIDGIWGDKSRTGTKQFQADNHLWCDGVFGFATEEKSIAIIKNIQKAVGATVDGLAGEKTKAATAEYQKKHGLTANGIADEKTRAKINGGSSNTASTTTTNTTNKTTSGTWWDRIRYFERDEFRCPCGKCGGFPVEPKETLVTAVDDMREAFGKPVIVVPPDGHSGGSGVRCQRYNDSLSGSVPNSRHVYGKAADFKAPGVSASTIETYLAKIQREGKIRYWYKICSGSYHMDVE